MGNAAQQHEHGRGNVRPGRRGEHPDAGAWSDCEWITGADGKARRVKSGVRLLAYGSINRVGRLRAYGNAIVPQVAAEFIGAYLDTLEAPGVGDERDDRGA